jgi:hypothetical protein
MLFKALSLTNIANSVSLSVLSSNHYLTKTLQYFHCFHQILHTWIPKKCINLQEYWSSSQPVLFLINLGFTTSDSCTVVILNCVIVLKFHATWFQSKGYFGKYPDDFFWWEMNDFTRESLLFNHNKKLAESFFTDTNVMGL